MLFVETFGAAHPSLVFDSAMLIWRVWEGSGVGRVRSSKQI